LSSSYGYRHQSSAKEINRRGRRMDAQKQSDLQAFLKAHEAAGSETTSTQQDSESKKTIPIQSSNPNHNPKHKHDRCLESERTELFQEATYLTKSLYRSCLRSVSMLQRGNQHDENEFKNREEEQEASLANGKFSFEPSVDRENELYSRGMYYDAYCKESFSQEVDCLHSNPWREDNLSRFLYLMRKGEEKRKWILKDYKFDDPFADNFEEQRLKLFEEEAMELVNETYKIKGWAFQKDFQQGGDEDVSKNEDDDKDGIDWDEDDDEEDDK